MAECYCSRCRVYAFNANSSFFQKNMAEKYLQKKVKIGAFGIITDDRQRVLLCHRTDRDLWNLPGGKLEEGESPWEAVIREIKEETGLEAKAEKLIGVYSKPQKNEIVLSFKCKVVGGQIKLTDEADRIEYFEISKIPKNILRRQMERIDDYFKGQDKALLKIQK